MKHPDFWIKTKCMAMEYRNEKDTMGTVQVPADRYWGAQTQRSLNYFVIGDQHMPMEVIKAYAVIKKAAARTNYDLGHLTQEKTRLISQVCDEIIAGDLDDHFPLKIWQTGSGTHTNMNVNEVIANRAKRLVGIHHLEEQGPLHPNDDVNRSQSTNDTFSAAMYIALYRMIIEVTLPGLQTMLNTLAEKSKEFENIVKIGRTHCMDAVPLSLGQEFSGYEAQLREGIDQLDFVKDSLLFLPLGGTAVGTGLNAPEGYTEKVNRMIGELTGYPFGPAENHFKSIAAHHEIVAFSSHLKSIATIILKIVNDLRMLASGPRCGIGELIFPANEPGSSIMPGKVNPTQIEAMAMVCSQVIGNDQTISVSGSNGHFELNAYKPVMIKNALDSARIMGEAAKSLSQNCLTGIQANKANIHDHLNISLMLITVLNTYIGYEKASEIAKKAYNERKTLRDVAIELNYLTGAEFDQLVDPRQMTGEKK